MRSQRIIVAIVIVQCGMTAWPAPASAQTRPDFGVAPASVPRAPEAAAAASTDSIAVIVFSNISGAAEDDWFGVTLVETLTADVAAVGALSTVGRSAVSRALENLSAGQGADAEATEVRAGRLLGVRWVIGGAYQRLGERLRITARVLEVASATVVHTAKIDGLVTELFALQDRLAADLRRGLSAVGGAGPASAAARTPTISAPANAAVGTAAPSAISAPTAPGGRGFVVAPGAPDTPVAAGGIILPATSLQPGDRSVRHLSVDEAVTLALEQNLDLRVERLNPQIQDLSIAEARSVYAPTLSTSFISDNQNFPTNSFLSGGGGATNILFQELQDSVEVVQELPWAGGRYSASWDGARSTTTSIFTAVYPQLRSNLSLNYTQPLLRNLRIDGPRLQIAITRANREISDIQLRRAIVQTRRTVRNAYWDLVFAQSFLEVQRQSLDLSQESLRGNRRRVEVGTMAPIDIVQAESEVARNEEGVILAEAGVGDAEDRLRALVFDPDAPDFWSIQIQPSDNPVLQAQEIDMDAAVRNALDNRTDLHTLDKDIENTETNIRFYRNQRLPDVNLDVNYRVTGIGGTFLGRDDFYGPVTSRTQTSFGSVLGNLVSNDFPTWTVGVTVAYPLGTSSAKANLEQSRLLRTQAAVNRRSLEVRIAIEVRSAGRRVTANLQRVALTRTARQLTERRLEAEQRRFEVGQTETFFVFQAQRDLSFARISEQQAILDYGRSLVDFDAVQDVPLLGAP